jgi:hypothetical protein
MYACTRAVRFSCSIGLVGALRVASARSGFQEGPVPNGDIKLNCDQPPAMRYEAFFGAVARRNPPPNLPPSLPPNSSSNGRDLDRGFFRADEREDLLAYLRKL